MNDAPVSPSQPRAEPVRHDIPSAEALSALADEIEEMTVPVPRDLLLMKNERALIVLVLRSHASLKAALAEAIAVFEGMCDDEIEVELLPRLRAALEAKPAGETENG